MSDIVAHMMGDYVLQTDHMAQTKTGNTKTALAHGIVYALPFLAITRNLKSLAVIAGTHALIDRYRLARYVVWAKNQLAPKDFRYPLSEAGPTGYGLHRDPTLSVVLMIAADNSLHLAINRLALSWSRRKR
jgi:hypothetical protein